MAYKRICGIYTITNVVNNKKYVGYSRDVSNRLYKHKCNLVENKHDNDYLQKAFNKYGLNNFNFELLVICKEEYLESEENYWCNILDTHNRKYGYNIQPTSPLGNTKMSEESKEKIRKALTGKPKSAEHIKKMKEYGVAHMFTPEAIAKRVAKRVGKKITYEHWIKCKENGGIRHPVLQYSITGKFLAEYPTMIDAAKKNGISRRTIGNYCMGRGFSARTKYIWRYKIDENFSKQIEIEIGFLGKKRRNQ